MCFSVCVWTNYSLYLVRSCTSIRPLGFLLLGPSSLGFSLGASLLGLSLWTSLWPGVADGRSDDFPSALHPMDDDSGALGLLEGARVDVNKSLKTLTAILAWCLRLSREMRQAPFSSSLLYSLRAREGGSSSAPSPLALDVVALKGRGALVLARRFCGALVDGCSLLSVRALRILAK